MEYVQIADTPGGQRYTVVTAPPGSALDAGGRFGTGGVIGALVPVGMDVARFRTEGLADRRDALRRAGPSDRVDP